MAKNNHFKTVIFTEEFAGRNADTEFECDGMLAKNLVNRGVAKYKDQPGETPEQKPAIKKTKKTSYKK